MTQPANEQDIFQKVVLGLPTPARMATAMVSTPPAASVSRRWGMIDAINGNGTVDVNIGGVVVQGVRKIAWYTPTIDETVMVDVVGGDIIVVGTLPPSPLNDYDSRLSSLSTQVTGNTAAINAINSVADTGWTTPTLLNGWVNYDLGTPPFRGARYKRLSTGQVEIQGLVKSGSTNIIFNLPSAYRPGQNLIFAVVTNPNVAARLTISSNGDVYADSYDPAFVSINCTFTPG